MSNENEATLNSNSTNHIHFTQNEKMNYVKLARISSYTADKIATIISDLTTKLEEDGLLNPARISKTNRDKKLRALAIQRNQSDCDVQEMLKQIPKHPDSDKLMLSLFKDFLEPNPPLSNHS